MTREQMILGLCMKNPKNFQKLYQYENVFEEQENVKIFFEMKKLYEKQKAFDIISFPKYVLNEKCDISISSVNEIVDSVLHDYIPEENFAIYLRESVEEKAKKELIKMYNQIHELTYEEIKEKISTNIKIIKDKFEQKIISMKSFILTVMDGNEKEKIFSGYNWIDNNLGGWIKGEVVIIGARPSQGKTTLWNNFATKMILNDVVVGFFSAEEDKKNIATSMVSCISGVNSQRIYQKKINEQEIKRVDEKMRYLYEKKYFIDDTPNIDIEELKRKTDIMVNKHNVEAIGIDYLQLLKCDNLKNAIRREQVGYISREIKELARKYNIVIFALAQLNRDAENTRPTLANLKDCGDIEQDADRIIFIYEVNNISETQSYVKIIFAKNRHGMKGEFNCYFEKDICKFKEVGNEK